MGKCFRLAVLAKNSFKPKLSKKGDTQYISDHNIQHINVYHIICIQFYCLFGEHFNSSKHLAKRTSPSLNALAPFCCTFPPVCYAELGELFCDSFIALQNGMCSSSLLSEFNSRYSCYCSGATELQVSVSETPRKTLSSKPSLHQSIHQKQHKIQIIPIASYESRALPTHPLHFYSSFILPQFLTKNSDI